MQTQSLAQRSDPHLARRIWHTTGVLGMFAVAYYVTPETAFRIALYVSGTLVTLDAIRLRYPSLNHRLVRLFRPVLRESERHRLTGSTFMLIGVTLITYFFPKPVLLLTLLFFAFADPLAGYVGTRYGRDRLIGKKTLQGSLAAFGACFILTVIYCIAFQVMIDRLVIVSLLCGLIGAASELIPVANLDDNFVFPVLSAALITVVFMLFGGL